MKTKKDTKWAYTTFMTKVQIRRKQYMIGTNLDEAMTVVGLVGWYNEPSSDVLFFPLE